MAPRLFFLRHGQTEFSRDNLFCGRRMDPPLTPDGVAMAEAFAKAYRKAGWTAIFSSPLNRAITTASELAHAIALPVEERDGLAELDYGAWDGKSVEEVERADGAGYERWRVDPVWNAPPDGETASALARRVTQVIEEVLTTFDEGNVLLVAHKATIRVALCALLGVELARFRDRFACPTASLSVIEFRDFGPMAISLADRSHLDDRLRALNGT